MNDLRTAAQQALEALRAYGAHAHNCDFLILLTSNPPQRKPCSCGLVSAIKSIEAALDEPEPVAWEQFHEHLPEPFYASPQQQAAPEPVAFDFVDPVSLYFAPTTIVAQQAEPVADEMKAQAFDALNRMQSIMMMNDGRHPRNVLRAFVQLASAPPTRQPLTPAQEAAPELLEALKYALKDMCQVRDQVAHNRLLVSIGVASAAITKAERQPSDEMRAAMDAAREAN